MIWTRIMNDYGHIDDETPSLAMSVTKKYQNKGIGMALLKEMIKIIRKYLYQFKKRIMQ